MVMLDQMETKELQMHLDYTKKRLSLLSKIKGHVLLDPTTIKITSSTYMKLWSICHFFHSWNDHCGWCQYQRWMLHLPSPFVIEHFPCILFFITRGIQILNEGTIVFFMPDSYPLWISHIAPINYIWFPIHTLLHLPLLLCVSNLSWPPMQHPPPPECHSDFALHKNACSHWTWCQGYVQ